MLERDEIIPGNLMSAQVILARATGADPRTLAAVLRGAMAEQVPPEMLRKAEASVLVLNGSADVANRAITRLLEVLPNARSAACDGDHGSTRFRPSFQRAICAFFEEQWCARGLRLRSGGVQR